MNNDIKMIFKRSKNNYSIKHKRKTRFFYLCYKKENEKNLTIIFVLLLELTPINTFALESIVKSRTIKYLGDGIYVETTVESPNISTYATNTITKIKTRDRKILKEQFFTL